jgi:hypothetical protein
MPQRGRQPVAAKTTKKTQTLRSAVLLGVDDFGYGHSVRMGTGKLDRDYVFAAVLEQVEYPLAVGRISQDVTKHDDFRCVPQVERIIRFSRTFMIKMPSSAFSRKRTGFSVGSAM